jgi:hypothetical protein
MKREIKIGIILIVVFACLWLCPAMIDGNSPAANVAKTQEAMGTPAPLGSPLAAARVQMLFGMPVYLTLLCMFIGFIGLCFIGLLGSNRKFGHF